MTGYHHTLVEVPRSFAHVDASHDPWTVQASLPSTKSWNKGFIVAPTTPPSLFDTDDEQQDWSPHSTPPSSPPNIAAIKKSLIQAQHYLSTASPIDPWTVSQVSPPSIHLKKSKKRQQLQQQQQQQQQEDINLEEELTAQNLYKTELCRSFMETNSCRYGIKCQFAHGRHEIRPIVRHPKYKTEICKTFHTLGTCPYGTRCRFIHTRPKAPCSDNSPSSSTDSSEFSSPCFTPPDSPSLHSSSSPPEILQWSTSWVPLDARTSLPPPPMPKDDIVEQVPPTPELQSSRRLPIFRNLSSSKLV